MNSAYFVLLGSLGIALVLCSLLLLLSGCESSSSGSMRSGWLMTDMACTVSPSVKEDQYQFLDSLQIRDVITLVDLQPGRSWIAPGRSRTHLTSVAEKSLRDLKASFNPIVGIRNDWGLRNGYRTPGMAMGYTHLAVENEVMFCLDLKQRLGPLPLLLAWEASDLAAADFCHALAIRLREVGYQAPLYANLIGGSLERFLTLGSSPIILAPSLGAGGTPGQFPIANMDGLHLSHQDAISQFQSLRQAFQTWGWSKASVNNQFGF